MTRPTTTDRTATARTSTTPGPTDVVGARAIAQLVDAAVSLVLFAVVAGATALVLGGAALARYSVVSAIWAVGPLAMLAGGVVAGGVPVVLEWAWDGKTVGKRLLGIRVVPIDGGPLGFGAVLTRNLLAGIDAAFFYLVGLTAMATSPHRQRLGDRVAGTVVVRS